MLGNLRLPATLFVSTSAAAGGGANLAISAIAALTAAIVHLRAGRINWRLVGWMAPPSVVGAVAGGFLAGTLPGALLGSRLTGRLSECDLVRAIGAVLLVAAAGTFAQAVT